MEERGFISLSNDEFLSVYKSTETTSEVIKILSKEKQPIIEIDHSYQENEYSKGYRLCTEYFVDATKEVQVLTQAMRKYIIEYRNVFEKGNKKLLGPLQYLVDFIEKKNYELMKWLRITFWSIGGMNYTNVLKIQQAINKRF